MNRISLDNARVPLHYQVSEYLEDMLKRGDLRGDERVPPEEELVAAFGVSRTTVRRSLDHLLEKGLVTKKQGKGTYWTDAARRLPREKLAGVNKQIFSVSAQTTVRVLSKSVEKGNQEAARFLGDAADSDFVVFRRIRYIDDEPMSYTVNYLPRKYGALISRSHLRRMTMLETLESVVKIRLGMIEHEVEITRATAEISRNLGLSLLDPVLTIRTSVYDAQRKPVEIVWTYFVENTYKFRVMLE